MDWEIIVPSENDEAIVFFSSLVAWKQYLIDTFWDVSLFMQYAFIFVYLEASAASLCWFLNLVLKNAINLIWIDFIF